MRISQNSFPASNPEGTLWLSGCCGALRVGLAGVRPDRACWRGMPPLSLPVQNWAGAAAHPL